MTSESAARRFARNEYTWVGVVFIAAIAIAYLILRSTTTGTFDKLEQQNIADQANRISTSLNYERSGMANYVITNSEWTSAFDAIAQDRHDAMSSLFTASQLRDSFHLGAVMLLNTRGQVVTGGTIPSTGSRFVAPDAQLARAVANPTVAHAKLGETNCGVLEAGIYYLYCTAPVVHDNGSGPSDGWFVALQAFDAAGTVGFGQRAGIDAKLADTRLSGATSRLGSSLGSLTVKTVTVSGSRTDLLVAIPAVEGAAPLVLRATFPRPIHAAAMNSATDSALIIGILGIALLLISIIAQRSGVVRRNRSFQMAVRKAAANGGHVAAPSKDLTVLAESVNTLLDEISARQQQARPSGRPQPQSARRRRVVAVSSSVTRSRSASRRLPRRSASATSLQPSASAQPRPNLRPSALPRTNVNRPQSSASASVKPHSIDARQRRPSVSATASSRFWSANASARRHSSSASGTPQRRQSSARPLRPRPAGAAPRLRERRSRQSTRRSRCSRPPATRSSQAPRTPSAPRPRLASRSKRRSAAVSSFVRRPRLRRMSHARSPMSPPRRSYSR